VEIKKLLDLYYENPKIQELLDTIGKNNATKINVSGLVGSSKSFVSTALFKKFTSSILFIANEKEDAAYLYNDLFNLLDQQKVFFFPSSFKRSIKYKQTDTSNIILRTETINKIQSSSQNIIIVSYPEAIAERIVDQRSFTSQKIEYKTDQKITIEEIHQKLEEFNFERTDFVFQPGQYSIRGSIIDIFSYSNRDPIRIDFFGDEIESIRTFNIENQLSKKKLDSIILISNISDNSEKSSSIFDFIHNESLVIADNISLTLKEIDGLVDYLVNSGDEDSNKILNQILTKGGLVNKLIKHNIIDISQQPYFESNKLVKFNTLPQPSFNKNFELLIQNVKDNKVKDIETFLFSDSTKQIERIKSIFQDTIQDIPFKSVEKTISGGFIDNETGIACYTDHQIFNRYHKYKLDTNFSKKESLTIQELNSLSPGDFVVHIDHGIAKFGGLARIENNGKHQEAIKLIFKDSDILFVSIHSLHRISKYKGKEGIPPKVYKLGTGAWQKIKQNTKKKVKDIAKDLIELYAQRLAKRGFRFSSDTYLQNELEASFIYEDTPDQIKSTQDVKNDMESEIPMDRLVCGDVGFGKTEIAIRAAFKAVNDSKQVAILVPTTILAMQHYQTFKERLADFPCSIDYVSRLKKPKSQKEALEKAKTGKVDILIGTHRIVSKDVQFKNLGLLIIDEEQKFGVSLKEKLRYYKKDIDTLTLTATPIPRTLQFSLMGARDLSIINTPPPNRHPIITELHTFNEDIISEAITYEIQRNGQVFFINNRVQNIQEITDMIHRICPDANVVFAHGKMDGPQLEKIMIDFINGEYDVLVSTTIIESGLDIPNANTIIINNAHHFGLSDLHQLRGRVGRSNKKAFCYLLAPPVTTLTTDARRRLKALEDFSELGSGFNIALQDLDIRGAGNLLGAEQSGFIADIGFDAYQKILKEAMHELKESEYKELIEEDKSSDFQNTTVGHNFVSDCQIDTDLELLFPEEYISSSSERIKLYRELDNLEDEEQLENFKSELVDRFGKIPEKSIDLLNIINLRWLAMKIGIEKIILKNKTMVFHFVSNQASPFYQSRIFINMITYVQSQGNRFKLKETKDKLSLSIQAISSVKDAMDKLNEIYNKSY
jgi:transcription-repair coupling factor (superfamily II helicase)